MAQLASRFYFQSDYFVLHPGDVQIAIDNFKGRTEWKIWLSLVKKSPARGEISEFCRRFTELGLLR